jgi:hypothetical protein
LKAKIESIETSCAIKIQDKQKLINLLISAAAKKDVTNSNEIRSLHEHFFAAKARMIDERVAEHDAHDVGIKVKDQEAEARDLKYLNDLKRV